MAEEKEQQGAGFIGSDPDVAVRQGGANQGQGSGTGGDLNDGNPDDVELRRLRASRGDLVDDNAAAHMGGMGAQGGVADLASEGNLAGTGGNLTGGSNPQP